MVGPLDGLLVVDLTRALSGPHATMTLGDLGARVIKVEPPRGDESRGWGPPFLGPAQAPVSSYFLSCNRNKESVRADLRTPEGRELLEALVLRADVLCENGRPGALRRLGFPPERLQELNPALVVLSISGFGPDGPEASRPGYDQIAQGEGGLMSVTGPPGEPTRMGVPITDLLAGMNGVIGVLAALHERTRTGRGKTVHTSLLAAAVGVHAYQGTRWTVAGLVPHPQGNHHSSIAPYGPFHAADGILQITVGTEDQWRALAAVVGLDAEDERFVDNANRVANRDLLVRLLDAALSSAPLAHWQPELERAGVPSGRIRRIDEVYEWDQARSQGLVRRLEHPVLGTIEVPGSPLRLGPHGEPVPAGSEPPMRPPPALGEHDASVREWLGLVPASEPTGGHDA